jgi:hypothetical protein
MEDKVVCIVLSMNPSSQKSLKFYSILCNLPKVWDTVCLRWTMAFYTSNSGELWASQTDQTPKHWTLEVGEYIGRIKQKGFELIVTHFKHHTGSSTAAAPLVLISFSACSLQLQEQHVCFLSGATVPAFPNSHGERRISASDCKVILSLSSSAFGNVSIKEERLPHIVAQLRTDGERGCYFLDFAWIWLCNYMHGKNSHLVCIWSHLLANRISAYFFGLKLSFLKKKISQHIPQAWLSIRPL